MTQLDDDIARIAALRGKPVNYYTERQDARRRSIPPETIHHLFVLSPDWRREQHVYDHLPARSREYISESVLPLNAQWWDALLDQYGGEEEIIGLVEAQMPGRRRDWIRKHYGRDHPGLRRLG